MSELLRAILLEAAFTVYWTPLANAEMWEMLNDNWVLGAPMFRAAYLAKLHDRDGTLNLEIVAVEEATRRIEQWTHRKSA